MADKLIFRIRGDIDDYLKNRKIKGKINEEDIKEFSRTLEEDAEKDREILDLVQRIYGLTDQNEFRVSDKLAIRPKALNPESWMPYADNSDVIDISYRSSKPVKTVGRDNRLTFLIIAILLLIPAGAIFHSLFAKKEFTFNGEPYKVCFHDMAELDMQINQLADILSSTDGEFEYFEECRAKLNERYYERAVHIHAQKADLVNATKDLCEIEESFFQDNEYETLFSKWSGTFKQPDYEDKSFKDFLDAYIEQNTCPGEAYLQGKEK
ncbi:MAG: hypothetical protein AAF620_12365 [Bacteroidota bacterium]